MLPDAVAQHRQHMLLSDCAICLAPLACSRLSLFSLCRHYYCFIVSRFLSFARPLSYHPSLTRLSYSALLRLPSTKVRHEGANPRLFQTLVWEPFPVRVWPCLALATHRYYDGSDSCLPSPQAAGLPAYLTTSSRRSASNHVMQPRYRFTRHIPAYRASFGLRRVNAGSSSHTAESSSLYCGPPVRLRLLSTPPRGDAVTFDYRALAYPDTDFHHADIAPSRAHADRLEAGGFNHCRWK